MARGEWVPTDDELSKAKDVIERAYRGWVLDLVDGLLFEAFNEDIDEDEFRDRIDERTDSGLVYTNDQWTTLFASRNTQEAWDELRDMDSTNVEDPVAPWAVMTYRQDVNAAIWDAALLEPIREGMDLEERITWLIENHSKAEYPIGPEGTSVAYHIGTIDEVGFGWLWVWRNEDGDYEKHEFIGAGMDDGTMKVLMDLILETGGDPHSPRAREFRRQASGARR